MNKTYLSFFVLVFFVFSMLSVSLASADVGTNVKNFLDGTVNAVKPVTTLLLGDKGNIDNNFIAIMAFLLTLLVVAGIITPLHIFGDKAGINWGIAVIVAAIGVRFIPIDSLRAFTLGSEGLVGALFLIVPFLVVATLIVKGTTNGALRKILWIVYTVVMVTLFAYNWGSADSWRTFHWVYVVIIALCIVMFLMDGTIQKFFRRGSASAQIEHVNSVEIDMITAEIGKLEGALAKAKTSADRTRIMGEIKVQQANLKALTK